MHRFVHRIFAILLTATLTGAAEIPWVKAIDIRSLTPKQADEERELRLRGTFIFRDPGNAIFLQDETAGGLFWLEVDPMLRPGDVVEVQGTTRSGLYVPGLDKASYQVVSHGEMPAPLEVDYDDLLSGSYHYQWVSVEGIARAVSTDAKGKTKILLALGSRIVEVHVENAPEPPDFVDSKIRVTGLAAGGLNDRRQLIQPYVWPHDLSGIEIVEPPPDPATLEAISASELLTFRPIARTGHRVRVKGTVLGSFPEGRIFIREGKNPLSVKLTSPVSLEIGDHIDVLGFPQMDRFSAVLMDASIVKRTIGGKPTPLLSSVKVIATGAMDHELVSFVATVVDSFRTEKGASILLQTSGASLRADAPPLIDLPVPGSHLQITGICQVESSRPVAYSSRPESISILVRKAEDIAIIKSPSWWTTRRLTAALFILAGLVFLAGLWILLLRRQVDKQTSALRQRIEHQAMLEERQRIAREFHDTLEQDLTGLSLQLGAAAAKGVDEKNRGPLDTARHLISRIQTETRNLLSDLRTPPDQALDLIDSLQILAEKHPGEIGPRVEILPTQTRPHLPPRTVHHLRMIAQESVTNAIKHANATLISIKLTIDGGDLVLTIADDGKGFDPESETWEKPGHFGCMGMRERSRKLGAEVTWQSVPAHGTAVTVRLPISPKNP